MVVTCSQRKLMAGVGEEPQFTCEFSMEAKTILMNKLLDQIDEVIAKMDALEAENVEL